MKRRKRRVNIKIKIKLILILVLVVLIGIIIQCSKIKPDIRDDEICRDITKLNGIQNEPENRKIPWSSELPDFVEADIEYMKKNSNIESIKYIFGMHEIYIYEGKDEELYINDYDSTILSQITDFSIYKKNDKLVIYGYSFGDYFEKVAFGRERLDADYENLASSKQFPIKKDEYLYSLAENDKYALATKDDKVCIYHKGKIVSEETIKDIKNSYYNGIIITEENELYMVYMIPEKPKIHKEYIGTIDSELEDEIVKIENYTFPLFKKGNSYYVPVPNDWDTYQKYVLFEENDCKKPDFGMKLVSIEKLFDSAKIEFHKSIDGDRWKAEIALNLNGKKATYSYEINGYDGTVSIPEEEQNTVVVNSNDEFWEEVYKIREMYKKYYDEPKEE